MIDEKGVLDLVTSKSYRQMTTEELARKLSVKDSDRDAFVALLEDLQRRGHLFKLKKGQWVNPEHVGLVTGRLQCNPRGFGFIIPIDEEREDLYVSTEDMAEAMDGDLVVGEPHRKRRSGRRGRRDLGPSARIIKVLQHANRQIIGTFEPGRKFGRVVADNPRIFRDVYVAREDWNKAREGELVLVEVTAWPSLHRNPEGVVKSVLGDPDAPGVDVQSVILEFNLPREFPQEVLQAAQAVPESPPEAEVKQRRDFRDRLTITVDPEDAKDFDDALSLYRNPNSGNRVALVHIADASFSIRPDSPLDVEARKRGCSVYLANEVVPMMPHRLSKEQLSLVEGKDRLAKTVTLEFDDEGNVLRSALSHSVVRIDRRMSYTEVMEILEAVDAEEPAARAAAEKTPDDLLNLLIELDKLAGQLRARRTERGSVDLDVPDYEVSIDDEGLVAAVTLIVRDRSHSLVEEFMLAANCAVADFLVERKLPGLFRVHDDPPEEDLQEFATFIRTTLHRRIDPLDRKQLQQLLAEVSGTNVAEAVNMQLLRSMQRAAYTPSCRPHFALHFDRYCHFTSPVRRYPDLVVHQILDQHLAGREPAGRLRGRWKPKLPRIATHCNQMQERADEAEREIIKIKMLRYLEQHQGEVFEAVITGVQEYGVFARLEGLSAEGLVKVKTMRDDFYRYDEDKKALVGTRTGRTFRLGEPIKVVISRIDTAHRLLDLELQD